jgi:hypothetical protein
MKNWVEITVSLDHERKQETVRAELPDLSDYSGKMSVFGVVQPRLYDLCERVSGRISRKPAVLGRYQPSDQEDDGGINLPVYGDPGALSFVEGGE